MSVIENNFVDRMEDKGGRSWIIIEGTIMLQIDETILDKLRS